MSKRSRAFGNLFPRTRSLEVIDQAFVATTDYVASARTLEERIAILEDRPCARQAPLDVDMIAAINHDTIIVVPEVSLRGDQRRDRAMYYIPCRMNQRSTAGAQVE